MFKIAVIVQEGVQSKMVTDQKGTVNYEQVGLARPVNFDERLRLAKSVFIF